MLTRAFTSLRQAGPVRRLAAHKRILVTLLAAVAVAVLAFGAQVLARGAPEAAQAQPSPLHPTFALRDAAGANVLDSGGAVSTMQTCGQCHDAAYIEQHSFHADLGLSDFGAEGLNMAQPWDQSRGSFGKWDPLTYRFLSPAAAERLDLGTPEWLMRFGARIPGGGPATTARAGESLLGLAPDADNPETSILDVQTGAAQAWNWADSGVVEMDCFLCHLSTPDNSARSAAISTGDFGWANTATLLATGIVTRTEEGYVWQPDAFDADGKLKREFVLVQDPSNDNCAACHGVVHGGDTPLLIDACDVEGSPQTATTGQIISSQRINESGLNAQDKAALTRSWDIHAERAVQCTDCHYALNNPIHAQEAAGSMPTHLVYDPRRIDIGEYLERPNHNFARGASAQFTVAPELKGSMRRCESCHAAESTHADWLPYTARHLEVLACESCHIAQMHAPAVQSVDWTVLSADGAAVTECRGIEGSSAVTGLVTGFQPVLMQRTNVDGDTMLAPYNLITSWYWVYDDPAGATYPVRLIDLQAAYFAGDAYAPEVVQAFDADGDGLLSDTELVIDTPEKQALVAGRLQALGLDNPRIDGQVQPYSINHGVAHGDWATRDCTTCHSGDSLIAASLDLAGRTPGGVLPTFVSDANVAASGSILNQDGVLLYQPAPEADGIYIFGRDRVPWVDWFGAIFFVGVLGVVFVHAGLRCYATSCRHTRPLDLHPAYIYHAYERFWHWLQTVAIILLLFTGLIIHKPDIFGVFSFPHVVTLHNILAAVLVINAGLSLFWHVAGGEIRKFIPHPYGFFDQAILQAKYYLVDIFRQGAHPFEKTPERHLNPLQQVTYFGILNVLLPLQILTGALMWGVQRWPQFADALGGLPFLAPFHTLVAWVFASFIVGHVYLTTTGNHPLAGIRAMITGWEDVGDFVEQPGISVKPGAEVQPSPAHSSQV